MLKNSLTGLDKKKLRRWILLFFFAVAIPTAILIQQSYSRLKWETFHQHQLMADELATRIDGQFLRLIKTEEERSFTDYSFLNIAGDSKANMLQRSPLSKFPVESKIAGLIGFFQVNTEGELMTPLLPDAIKAGKSGGSYGISDKELALRIKLENKIQDILTQNRLVKKISPSKTTIVKKKKAKGSLFGNLIGSSRSESKDGSSLGRGMSFKDNSTADNFYAESITIEAVEADYSARATDDAISLNEIVVIDDAEQPTAQIAFDRLKEKAPAQITQNKLGRVEDLKLKKRYKDEESDYSNTKRISSKKAQIKLNKQRRVEQNILPEGEIIATKKSRAAKSQHPRLENKKSDRPFSDKKNLTDGKITKKELSAKKPEKLPQRILTFESVIDSFEFSQLDSGHFVLFRKVWLNDQRYIQGLLIEQKSFLEHLVNTSFQETSLSQMSDLLLSYQGNVLSAFSSNASRGSPLSSLSANNKELSGELLYQTRLSDPFGDLQLTFSITQLPIGVGGKVILWLSLILSIILCAGFYLMYRLGLGQINLANQQQDFVSAVSHELKTPLTSIRMYGEILREGWASEEKKKTYYNFIYDESERLSRLINNVLHLARVTRNKQSAELKEISVSALMNEVESKISTQVRHAGFKLIMDCELVDANITIDADWFTQIIINLVDNAIKFSEKAEQKKIELTCLQLKNNKIIFSVRDYGPGVDKAHMKKIFKLFYRTESELTRETVGTGIGLALVHQMVVSMGGEIDVLNQKPGAEFRVSFKNLN